MNTRKMVFMTMFAAIAVAGSAFVSFPAGIARAYPIQHAVNVIVAIVMGPGAAVLVAFVTGLVRILTGTGSLLALPGGMIGALLAGLFYQRYKRNWTAGIGEIIGTGFIAPVFAVPYAKILMGTTVTAFFFLPPFLVSTVSGSVIGLLLVPRLLKLKLFQDLH
ncbi:MULTISPECIES: energy coupling factor transporter S component ThiW [unclassified Sporosarcina]|uniref:energy coupling factor transporter S component ThiW n=1 Tax=unclassified Sporosarcina TaxID=2647733 RepID=UPI00203EAA99|nr:MULTISPECIES: energy coupling factor transporter S component ThiW [unclassified Sporosarcina]GKV66383.1 hypothetical protein NCCP2331_25360 [Sporosarcina sp. NCCP-2331]GLB56500.1 hypothetical protein NCCP2378_22870 [Sporosarcina sp. NCCP-2378]